MTPANSADMMLSTQADAEVRTSIICYPTVCIYNYVYMFGLLPSLQKVACFIKY